MKGRPRVGRGGKTDGVDHHMGRSLDELSEAICWIDRGSENQEDLCRDGERHYRRRQSDSPTERGAVSGVEQREERVATRDSAGDRGEYPALGVGCAASDE